MTNKTNNQTKEQEEINKNLPKNLTGHIVCFKEPLEIVQTIEKEELMTEGEHKGSYKIWWERTGKEAKCQYMRVEGGFGAYARCSGRMLIGEFYESIEDIKANKPYQKGNTKERPSGFIPSLFDINKVEKL